MALSRIWSKGQVTIPAEFRKRLHWEENTSLNMIILGESIVIIPHKAEGVRLAGKFAKEMKKKDISFDDLLKDLKSVRKKTTRERYGL